MPSKSLLRVQASEEDLGRATLRGYEFTLSNERGEVRASSELLQGEWTEYREASLRLSACLNELIGLPAQTGELWSRLVAATEQLMPDSIMDHLRQDEVLLELGCEGHAVPWEILPALAEQSFLSRVLGTPVRVLGRSVEGRSRALVGHDADGLCAWAEAEASAVESALRGSFEVHRRSGRELTRKQLLSILGEGSFGLVHLILYLGPAGLVLNDGIVKPAELERLPGLSRPRLVVIHAVTDIQTPLLESANRLATALMVGGVPAVLITGWNPHPEGARRLMEMFYKSPGELSIWQALRNARSLMRSADDAYQSWQAYFAYGDWDVPLSHLAPVSIETAQNAPTARGSWTADYQLTVLEGPQAGSRIPLYAAALDNGRQISIGRAGPVSVDLMLEDERLDNLTASLEKRDGRLLLSNKTADPASVKVNGLPVSGSVALRGCDELRFGQTICMRIEPYGGEGDSGGGPSLPEAGRYLLEVLSGVDGDRGRSFALESRVSLVGRLSDCALMLQDLQVSRHHLTLVPKGEGYVLSSIGSAQVVVNGFPLKEEHLLRHGDAVQLSPATILRFTDSRKKS